MSEFELEPTPRRGFLARLAAGSLALAASGFMTAKAESAPRSRANSPWDDSWMTRIKGKHRQIFDDMEVNSGFGPVMTRIWLMTNQQAYNIPETHLSAVLVLRHAAICIAMNDSIWAKYKLGEAFAVTDPVTSKPSERNIFAAAAGYPVPAFSAGAIDKLKESGVIMCACNMALMHSATETGGKIGVAADAAIAEWKAGLLPGVTLVPSGVLAVNRAQEHGCTYCNVS